MAESTDIKSLTISLAQELKPARPLSLDNRQRKRAVTIADIPDSRPAAFSFTLNDDFSTWGEGKYAPKIISWSIGDSSVIPPPPNTPADDLIQHRQALLHEAGVRCFYNSTRLNLREMLDNIPFRIDPITKTIRSNSLINFGPALKHPSNGGLLDDGLSIGRIGRKRPAWLDLLLATTPEAKNALRHRIRNSKLDQALPKAILKRKLKQFAFDDYLEQRYERDVKAAKITHPDSERASLQSTRDVLNKRPHSCYFLVASQGGKTIGEQFQTELVARGSAPEGGKLKRFSTAIKSIKKPTAWRKAKFLEEECDVEDDTSSVSVDTKEFLVVQGRRAKIGFRIKETISKLRGKFGGSKKEALVVVHF